MQSKFPLRFAYPHLVFTEGGSKPLCGKFGREARELVVLPSVCCPALPGMATQNHQFVLFALPEFVHLVLPPSRAFSLSFSFLQPVLLCLACAQWHRLWRDRQQGGSSDARPFGVTQKVTSGLGFKWLGTMIRSYAW